MPRTYDFSRKPTGFDGGDLFSKFEAPYRGLHELVMEDLIGPNGLMLFDGYQHQFSLQVPAGSSPYHNEIVDPPYQWLCDHATDCWLWSESESYQGGAITTSLFIRNEADADAFRQRWGDLFKFDEAQQTENTELWLREQGEVERNDLPKSLFPSRLATMITAFYPYSATYLTKLSGRNGFDDLLVSGIQQADATYASYKHSPQNERSPRNEDGTLESGLIPFMMRFTQWLAENACDKVRDELARYEFAEPEFGAMVKEALDCTYEKAPGVA